MRTLPLALPPRLSLILRAAVIVNAFADPATDNEQRDDNHDHDDDGFHSGSSAAHPSMSRG